jgi:hypothetical protein
MKSASIFAALAVMFGVTTSHGQESVDKVRRAFERPDDGVLAATGADDEDAGHAATIAPAPAVTARR